MSPQEANVGKRVWYKVEDTDLWALCTGEREKPRQMSTARRAAHAPLC